MKDKIYIFLGKCMSKISSVTYALISKYQKTLFKKCGDNVDIQKNCIFTYKTVSIGNNVFIGANAVMQSNSGEIIIGNHIAFGPGVHIFGGAHDFSTVGVYMKNNCVKNTGKIIIEDDCWIGSNVMILPKVNIGKGSVIGAGSIVTKDVPPYSIYVGTPQTKVIRSRFTKEEITEHERILQSLECKLK